MPELIGCAYCGRRVSSEAARNVGGEVVCPGCVDAQRRRVKAEQQLRKRERAQTQGLTLAGLLLTAGYDSSACFEVRTCQS